MIGERQRNAIFEDEVRSIARQLWPDARYHGAALAEGKERDGIFETEECVHLLEATTSRKKEKATQDIGKLVKLASSSAMKRRGKPVQCWFVTESEPTAEQRSVADKHRSLVNALSLRQFQGKLVDAATYINVRDKCRFGSICDPATGDFDPDTGYVALEMLDVRTEDTWSTDKLAARLADGRRAVILGDYGAGKSMTLREIYRSLRARYLQGKSIQFPLYINLREHYGQGNPAEAIERHARNIGFPQPLHLVRAWRAGYALLLIDGFDEVAGLSIQGAWRKLRDNRYRAMELVRNFVRDTPRTTGVAIAGRGHFFDNDEERRKALSLGPQFVELTLSEFSAAQIEEYLKASGYEGAVPAWLPTRPLFLGYLASKRLLDVALEKDGHRVSQDMDPAVGWDNLLDQVSDRECQIEAGIDGPTLRRVLERIGTRARCGMDGIGPIAADDVVEAFKGVCGYPPDEQAMVVLQRLPGLGVEPSMEGARCFVDQDFADACRAGDLVHFVRDPFSIETGLFLEAQCSVDSLGLSLAARRLRETPGIQTKLEKAIQHAGARTEGGVLTGDVARLAIAMGIDVSTGVYVKDVLIGDMELPEAKADWSGLQFQDCYFAHLDIAQDVTPGRLPKFVRCFFAEVEGRLSKRDLPPNVFDTDCDFDAFVDKAETTRAILALGLPLGVKVLLTIVKKVFVQAGKGRKESALFRGLDERGRRLVPDVLRLLKTENMIVRYRTGDATIWLPNRTQIARVHRILATPNSSKDLLLGKARRIG